MLQLHTVSAQKGIIWGAGPPPREHVVAHKAKGGSPMPSSGAPLHIGKLSASGSRHELSTPDKTLRAHAVREVQRQRRLTRRFGEESERITKRINTRMLQRKIFNLSWKHNQEKT